jgi:hypothetical protein
MPTAVYLVLAVAAVVACAAVWLYVRRPAPEPVVEPRIVEAVATMASVKQRPDLARRIEAAMSAAVHECLANGVSLSDTDTIRAAMLAARERVKREGN